MDENNQYGQAMIKAFPHGFIKRQEHPPSECNGTRTQNHLVCKRTLNHLANLKRVRDMIRTYSQTSPKFG